MHPTYCGIGSRITPSLILDQMYEIGSIAAQYSWILRSGAARGADTAFERGCDALGGQKEIYLPWAGFNKHQSTFNTPCVDATRIACSIHPRWDILSNASKLLVSRNMYQVLGLHLNTPVKCVICWTPDGCETYESYGRNTGGTGTAIALASIKEIPVFNLYNPHRYQQAVEFICDAVT